MGTRLRILLIEDSPDDAALLQRELWRAGYEPAMRRVADLPALAGALMGEAWDVVVADVHVPGVEVLDVLRLAQRRRPDVPFIAISGHAGDDQAAAIVRAGAHAFVAKRELARLVPTIERVRRGAGERGPPENEERRRPGPEPTRRDPATGPRETAD